jgi:hypothetical protein
MSEIWPFKDPDEVLDYDIDWTRRLYSADEAKAAQAQDDAGQEVTIVPADTISGSTFTLPEGTLAKATGKDSTFTNTSTTVWLQGGDEGTTYLITNEITTAGGRIMDQSVRLKVKSK